MESDKKIIDNEEIDKIYNCSICPFRKFIKSFGIDINHSNCWVQCDSISHDDLKLDATFDLLNKCMNVTDSVVVYTKMPMVRAENKSRKLS